MALPRVNFRACCFGARNLDRDKRLELTMSDVLHGIIDQALIGPDVSAVKDQNRELSYAELLDEVARLGTGLAGHGVVEGDRVALLLPNSIDFVVAALASLWIGAIFVPLAIADPKARLKTMLDDCAPAIVITSDIQEDGSGHTLAVDGIPFLTIASLMDRGEDLVEPIEPSSRP